MRRASRIQLRIATFSAMLTLGAGLIPASVQLLEAEPPDAALAPVEVPAPVTAPELGPVDQRGDAQSRQRGGGRRR